MKNPVTSILALAVAAFPLIAQTAKPSATDIARPRDVTYCELSGDPAAYNRQLVRLSAFVTHGFEDFHLVDPSCEAQGFSLWVMYGGSIQSNTIYCCPGEAAGKTRPGPVTIEGVEIPLVEDATFKSFTELLNKEADTTVRVTAVGRFFSGEKQKTGGQIQWGGAGHMGCCSLLVIQRVESFEPHTRSDVDYTSEAGWYEREGCDWDQLKYLRHVSMPYAEGELKRVIAEQFRADTGEADWAFNDPQRVALESLKLYYPKQAPVLRTVTKTPARHVYRWRNGRKQITVVVTRPYWLSFYAKSRSVAWVSTNIKEAGCR